MSKHCVRRRLAGLFLAAVLCLCSLPLSAGASPLFSDVPENAWFTRSILSLVEQGIVSGTGNGRFSPDAPLTRGQLAVIFLRFYEEWQLQKEAQPEAAEAGAPGQGEPSGADASA